MSLLGQEEADRLLGLEKVPANDDSYTFPFLSGKLAIDLINHTEREEFILNYTQSKINLEKRNHQMRGQQVIILARLDLYGPPHRNPDGQEIGPCHMHLYREGYGDKWAFPVPSERFQNLKDAYQTFLDFMRYCNVVEFPDVERSLFS